MAKAKLRIKVEGADDVLRAFDRFDKASRENLRTAVKKNANALRKGMQSRIHDVSGDLKKSIRAKYDKDGLGADVGPTRPQGSHAHLVEFGHMLVVNGQSAGHVPAHPFITPAAEEQRNPYLDDVRKAVKEAIPK